MGNTVDVMKATYTNTIGAVELKQVWTDPDFDPALQAVLLRPRAANPHPALDHLRRQASSGCRRQATSPPTIQERAWTSPIWYTPSEAARATRATRPTVADLRQRGATALDERAVEAI